MATKPFTIRNDAELAAAIDRADDLIGCTNDSDEERELAEICRAINLYIGAMRALRRGEDRLNPPRFRVSGRAGDD